jgi:lipoprotein-anchoring transpeptidase ErfK/SrfK
MIERLLVRPVGFPLRHETQNRSRDESRFSWRSGSLFSRRAAQSISICGLSLAGALAAASSPAPTPNEQVLRAQLFLDASAFQPGAIDGRWGEFMRKALTRYDQAQGKGNQKFGEKAPARFDLPLDEAKPLLISYTVSPNDQKFIGKVPASHAEQAKADSLPYENFLELLAEKFHARRDFLRQINPGIDWDHLKPGDQVQVPNVAAPFDVQEAIDLKTQTEQAEKANTLKTEDKKPESERFSIFVEVKEKILELKQGGKLAGSYPITPGSKSLPAPIGEWFVKGFSWLPTFRWDEAMLHDGERSKNFYQLPSGPNNPVGILWLELNHKGSGIHGTDAPETIGHTTSHGCIRLSNWNALDLGKKVLPGVHVTIR